MTSHVGDIQDANDGVSGCDTDQTIKTVMVDEISEYGYGKYVTW